MAAGESHVHGSLTSLLYGKVCIPQDHVCRCYLLFVQTSQMRWTIHMCFYTQGYLDTQHTTSRSVHTRPLLNCCCTATQQYEHLAGEKKKRTEQKRRSGRRKEKENRKENLAGVYTPARTQAAAKSSYQELLSKSTYGYRKVQKEP